MLQKFFTYSQLPEMRLFWIFLPFLVVLAGINLLYLPPRWAPVTLGIFFVLGFIVLLNNLRLARSHLEIKVERNELQSIITNLRDAVIAYDEKFRILIFNRAAEGIFGLHRERVLRQVFTLEHARKPEFKTLTQVIFPSLAPLVVRRSEQGVYPQIADISFTDPVLELRVVTDRIEDASGELLGFVKIVHDRTRELALLRSKTEFITVAAHQLRTPSTAVHWAFESLVKQKPNVVEAEELAQTGLAAATKLLKIINDLLDVSKIEEGKFGYQFAEVNISEFIEKVIQDMTPLANSRNVKLFFERPPEAITLSIDSQKLNMALANLLDNSIKYNIDNGEVVIGVTKLKDQPFIQISVKDTGIGIPSQDLDKLFSKFFRAENAMRAATEGTGLGLYIVRNIVKRHGGEVRVESELNRGTAFYITLPTDQSMVPSKEVVYGEE